ncbi:uncharacterized protein LOC129591426 isoform X2 [Paramacrobiotus metropolitanus]|uniref:uncharacterized protein LOC129591426 isoform X2 n=1 Tax=Paramacrobiotus metropolitanus TaxID=2943436 RepID=UPI0024456553|nr:uncharacterized protein LOC129591426 isoform X2 [Paramacrobiotus metropolitanus]
MQSLSVFCILLAIAAVQSQESCDDANLEKEIGGGCSDYDLVMGFMPMVEFCFSREGISLTFGRSRGNITDMTARSFHDFVRTCIAPNYTDAHTGAEGGLALTQMCQHSNAYKIGKLVFSCVHKMEQDHQRCMPGILYTVLPKDIESSSPQLFLRKPRIIWEACCYIQKYERCYMPVAEVKCTTEEVSANRHLLSHIYRSFNCAQHFPSCVP